MIQCLAFDKVRQVMKAKIFKGVLIPLEIQLTYFTDLGHLSP